MSFGCTETTKNNKRKQKIIFWCLQVRKLRFRRPRPKLIDVENPDGDLKGSPVELNLAGESGYLWISVCDKEIWRAFREGIVPMWLHSWKTTQQKFYWGFVVQIIAIIHSIFGIWYSCYFCQPYRSLNLITHSG